REQAPRGAQRARPASHAHRPFDESEQSGSSILRAGGARGCPRVRTAAARPQSRHAAGNRLLVCDHRRAARRRRDRLGRSILPWGARQLAVLAARHVVPMLSAGRVRHGVPAISGIREFVLAGGLMSYGASDTDTYRRAGSHYVAPILRGTKPGDLPVEMPTKYELVISVVAAKALGLTVPDKLLAT